MRYDPERHHRRSPRLKGHDYAQPGAYFVTVCVQDWLPLFGDIVDGKMNPNAAGLMVERWWRFLPRRFPWIDVDAFVVMPNHIHGIILSGAKPAASGSTLDRATVEHGGSPVQEGGDRPSLPIVVRADLRVCPSSAADLVPSGQSTLGTILQWFKTITTTDYIAGVNHMEWPPFNRRLWHRNYHDRIVRNDRELDRIRAYMAANPGRWHQDRDHRDGPPRHWV